MINAKIVADSKNEFGNRITTMLVTMPRIILAEFNTHRMLSKNSASSRAIPFDKMIRSVEDSPFVPLAWQKDHKGMQGKVYASAEDAAIYKEAWYRARNNAIADAEALHNFDITKQLCNRLLEPFMYHTVIVTATEWENFFALRCPQYEILDGRGIALPLFRSKKDLLSHLNLNGGRLLIDQSNPIEWLQLNKGQAEIHMMALAEAIWDAYNESTPKLLKAGEWHIPFKEQDTQEFKDFSLGAWSIKAPVGCLKDESLITINQIKIATTRGARTSYTVVGEDLKPLSFQRLCEIHDEMLNANPKHMSPFEHCAKVPSEDMVNGLQANNYWSGNFCGFSQYRKMIPNENITK